MDEPSNADRAEWARDAVRAFAELTRIEDEEMATQISDLVCNLRHLCDEESVDFEQVLSAANSNYAEECWEATQEEFWKVDAPTDCRRRVTDDGEDSGWQRGGPVL